jgi:Glycosyltransferase family 87
VRSLPLPVGRAARGLHAVLIIAASLGVTIWYATARGQDFNWDQRNYHIGVPFLLVHGTFWDSIAPAGIQSYLNPYVIEMQFFAIRHLSAISLAVMLAVFQSLAFMIAGLISVEVAHPTGGSQATVLGLLGFALSLLAPVPLSEAGTTHIELVTTVPVLGAYALLLTRGHRLSLVMSAALAGVLLGAATALKLTNGVFALGAVGFALAGQESLSRRIVWLVACGGAAIVAFAAVGGPWYIEVWEHFRNPFFPFFNNIFLSPDYPPVAFHDDTFLPHSFLAIWLYPLYWVLPHRLYWLLGGSPAAGLGSPSCEQFFRDARWIVAICGITLFLAALPIFRRWARARLNDPATGLLFTFIIGYVVWLFEFGIQRYAAPLDILCGAVLLALVVPLPTKGLKYALLFAMVLGSWRMMVLPYFERLPWRSYWQSINPQRFHFDGPTIVFLTFKPSFFVAASMPANTRYVGVSGEFDLRASNDTVLTRQLKQELISPVQFKLKEVDPGWVSPIPGAILASYDLSVTNRCRPLHVADKTFRICDVTR